MRSFQLKSVFTALLSCRLATALDWGPCDLEFLKSDDSVAVPPQPIDCARLSVPLDYADLSNPQTLSLQLLRVKAPEKPSRGTVIYNPGGPGGAGTEDVAFRAPILQKALPEGFDLVSWDPRGSGNTLRFGCGVERALQRRDGPILRGSSLQLFVNQENIDGLLRRPNMCNEVHEDIGELVGTVYTVRDLLAIVDALDGDGELHYWGSSYGTMIGATFAQMFGDRVGRVVLDGVVDPRYYWAGTWLESLSDADAAFSAFLGECAAHPDRCALAHFKDQIIAASPEDMLIAINENLQQLPEDWGSDPDANVTKDSMMMRAIYPSLFMPASWGPLGHFLLEFVKGNRSSEMSFFGDAYAQRTEYNSGNFGGMAVGRSDGAWRAKTLEEIKSLGAELDKVSSFAAAQQSGQVLSCANWSMAAKERRDGWGTKKIETANPVLIVNPLYDPITPMRRQSMYLKSW